MAPDVVEDIEELKKLMHQCKRPRIQALLSAEVERLQKGFGDSLQPNVPFETKIASPAEVRYTSLSSFSWEQDDEKVKIYISLEGASSEKTSSSFQDWSFDVKLHDINGMNYRCAVNKLHKEIDPDKSYLTFKPKRLIVTLKKREKGRWNDVYYKESLVPKDEGSNTKDMSGILDLMKNMYAEGDDDLKRTIAQAWTEARSGKKSMPFA